jgi:CubicO group peptidase (beta-lactamase class C family)
MRIFLRTYFFLLLLTQLSLPAFSQNLPGLLSKMDALEKELGFRGVVLVTQGDKVLLHKGYGQVDKNTVFQIASVTKAFTAVAIMKLQEQGRLRLEDPVGKYLGQAPPAMAGITIHQLLTHQSGLPQTYAAEGETKAEDATKAIFRLKPEATPGIKFIYSNGNYTLLALIIEKLTGNRWETYLQQTILQPLALQQSYFWADQNNTGLPEILPAGKIKKRKRDYGYLGSTGIFSTAMDLHRFLTALDGNSLLSDTSRKLLLGSYVKLKSGFANSTDYYAYGLFRTTGYVNGFWARGNEEAWGVSIAFRLPGSGISVVVLSDRQNLSNGEKTHSYVSSQIINILN